MVLLSENKPFVQLLGLLIRYPDIHQNKIFKLEKHCATDNNKAKSMNRLVLVFISWLGHTIFVDIGQITSLSGSRRSPYQNE